ncbi:MAG TPA: redoxin domain-containing protein [Pyrinomonadaceae bacterium]|nr:redoxin domain-containing protein [Pyrinomonadaceae bacterium]
MHRRLTLLAVCLSIQLTGFAAPAQKRSAKRMHRAATTAPAVTEIDTERLKSLLKRDSQRPLLVNFWATWCDPCRDEFPDLVKIDADYRGKGLDFIAISLDDLKDIKTEVPRFLRSMKAQMPVYLLNVPDPEVPITAVDAQWSGGLPATFLYDANGNIAYKHFGRIAPEELRAAIEKQVGAKQ